MVPATKRGKPNFENFKKGEPEKKIWDGRNQRVEKFSKIKGGTSLFKLNLGIENDKNRHF